MKFVASLVLSLFLALGALVAPAQALEPYPHSVKTAVKVKVKANNTLKVNVKAGTAKVKGTIIVKVVNSKGKVVAKIQAKAKGGATNVKLGKLAKGKYKVTVKLKTGANSIFKGSKTTQTVKIG